MATLHGRPLMSYKVVELKDALADRGLTTSGKKQELIERLETYILEHEIPDVDFVPGEPSKADNDRKGTIPPTVQIDTNLEENDIIKEYMMMRQSQFQSAMEEVKQHKGVAPAAAATTTSAASPVKKSAKKNVRHSESDNIVSETLVEDDEDIPLSRGRKDSPKKRRDRGPSGNSASESDEGIKSPTSRRANRIKSPVNYCEDDSPPPPPRGLKKIDETWPAAAMVASSPPRASKKVDKVSPSPVASAKVEARSPVIKEQVEKQPILPKVASPPQKPPKKDEKLPIPPKVAAVPSPVAESKPSLIMAAHPTLLGSPRTVEKEQSISKVASSPPSKPLKPEVISPPPKPTKVAEIQHSILKVISPPSQPLKSVEKVQQQQSLPAKPTELTEKQATSLVMSPPPKLPKTEQSITKVVSPPPVEKGYHSISKLMSPQPPKLPKTVEKEQHSISKIVSSSSSSPVPKHSAIVEKEHSIFKAAASQPSELPKVEKPGNKPAAPAIVEKPFEKIPAPSLKENVAMDLTKKCITTSSESVQTTASAGRGPVLSKQPLPSPAAKSVTTAAASSVIDDEKEAVDEILVSEPVIFDDTFDKDKEEEEESSNSCSKLEIESGQRRNSMEGNEKQQKEAPVTFRKMLRLGSQNETRKKRTWGDSKKTKAAIDNTTIAVSSSVLKDIIPDIKPVLEEIKHEEEQKMETDDVSKEQSAEVDDEEDEEKVDNDDAAKTTNAAAATIKELPKPLVEDPAHMQEKLAPVSEKNKNQSRVVEVRNLVRPFTNNQLIGLLKRTGGFDESADFWIDKIKSHALVKYQSAAEAEETVMALDGVKWPSSNQKKLIVTFSSDEHFEQQSQEPVSLSRQVSVSGLESASAPHTSSLKRSAAAAAAAESSLSGESRKRPRRDSDEDNKKKSRATSSSSTAEAKREPKSLEVLFKKTKALPSIYWMPKAASSSSSSS